MQIHQLDQQPEKENITNMAHIFLKLTFQPWYTPALLLI